MPENKTIYPNDNHLSLEANGLLSAMLNIPERDYHTAEELCTFSECDSLKTIRTALAELKDKEYIICVNGKYAVNKLMIPSMKVV